MGGLCYKFFGIVWLLVLACAEGKAQGCSDSGFCTMGAYKPDQPDLRKTAIRLNMVELTQHYGVTPFNDHIHSTFIDAVIGIGNRNAVQVRLPAYTIIQGKLQTTKGWGDVYINLTRSVYQSANLQVSLTGGVKLTTTSPTVESVDGLPLPLYRQVAYGSNDINLGLAVSSRDWLIVAGYQWAINQIDNQFNHSDWAGHTLETELIVYDESAGLARGNDLMLRVERNIRLSRFNIFGGLLGLYRVTKDRVLNEVNRLEEVDNSDGLALNLVVGARYQFNTRMGIKLLNSFRLQEREANPDGLNRVFISQFSFFVRF